MPTYPFEVPAEVAESLEKMILPETFPPPDDFDRTSNDDEPVFLNALLNWNHEIRCGFTAFVDLLMDHYDAMAGTTYEKRRAEESFMYLRSKLEESIERGEALINWIRTTWPYDPVIRKHLGDNGKPVDAPTQ